MLTSSRGFFSSFSRLFNCYFVISFDLHISMAFCNDQPFFLSSLPFKSLVFTPMTTRSRINSSVNAPNSQDEASFSKSIDLDVHTFFYTLYTAVEHVSFIHNISLRLKVRFQTIQTSFHGCLLFGGQAQIS